MSGTGLALGLQGVASGGNVVSTVLTNRANKKLAEYQYTKDLEMWNKSNEYNLPANQMKRLKDAGINPFMVYGGGQVSGNTVQSQTPKYQAPRLEAPQIQTNPNLMSSVQARYQQIEQSKVQTDQAKATLEGIQLNNAFQRATMQSRIDSNYYNAKTAGERAMWSSIKAKNDAINYDYNKATYGTRVAQSFQNYDSKAQDIMNKEFFRTMGQKRLNIDLQKLSNQMQILPYQIEQMKLGNILRGQQDVLNQREMELNRYGTQKSDPWYIRMPSQGIGQVKDWMKNQYYRYNGGGSW